ncbi:hypothetical protein TIN4_63 [Tsukamurella phage TIN4]|uniref:Uncharacterized protein n=2 Tax=Tinduovirus TIN3 TaxID=1982571 RepID=A0A0K0N627_9CAUD|nr:hypothetical protein AVT54_gp062 [Tsukamurella phage TIN3]YP_009604193.1 hypothetical protein FDH87_gp062 [Tsukamurella phage TIN4]AKJ71860.1 hypothetical protein TIN3_63 [Tsukamurella phage TIN3]AKJ71969.1 hypothetical protein TIN4_63 [Tsukamurella phage TIN4]
MKKKADSHILAGTFGPFRRLWVKACLNTFVLYIRPNQRVGYGVDVELNIDGPSKRSVAVVLTAMTEEELVAAKRAMDIAFECALDSVRARDRIADEALADGDISMSRIFREPPVIWRREGGEMFEETIEHLPNSWLGRTNIDASQFERSIASKQKSASPEDNTEDGYGVGAEVTDLD